MLPTKFRFIWPSGFRGDDFFQKSTNQKQELPVVAMFANGSGHNKQLLQMTCHRGFLPSFGSFGKVVSEEKIFKKSANQIQELHMATMFVNGSELNKQSLQRTFQGCFLPSFASFGQAVSEKIFQKSKNQKQEWPGASYQVSVHLAKRFQRRRFLKIGQSETRIACGGHVC